MLFGGHMTAISAGSCAVRLAECLQPFLRHRDIAEVMWSFSSVDFGSKLFLPAETSHL